MWGDNGPRSGGPRKTASLDLMEHREQSPVFQVERKGKWVGGILVDYQFPATGSHLIAGYTGANLDRPALRRLLTDIEAGRIDCVLVYKVDRLSRSLLDFARLTGEFDKR